MKKLLLSTMLFVSSLCANVLNPSLLNEIFADHIKQDPKLQEHIENFPYQDYEIFLVENRINFWSMMFQI